LRCDADLNAATQVAERVDWSGLNASEACGFLPGIILIVLAEKGLNERDLCQTCAPRA
jgi:hypothetical protein